MIGTTVSHYQIRDKLGAGGMGVVYKAWDTDLDRWVALKFLPQHADNDPIARERFMREAKAASALEHPHICTIHEIGETDDGQLYICMAYYAGPNLRQVIRSGNLTTARALETARQLCSALGRAHEEGIVHRDLKPSNVMTTSQGDAAIVDFGLAKLAGEISITRTGATMGTTAYMSPEQLQGRELDFRTDLWSLGIILYQLLTGKHPFSGDYERAMQRSILEDEPAPPSTRNAEVSPHIDEVVLQLLAKDRNRRHTSAGEVSQLLHGASGSSLDSRMPTELVTPSPSPPPPSTPAKRRRNLWITLVAAVVAVGIAFLAWPPPNGRSDEYERARRRLGALQDPGRFESAEGILREVLRRDPDHAPALALLSEALVGASGAKADPSLMFEAERTAQRALELSPQLPAAQIALARVHRETNRNPQAIEALQRLVSTHPDLDEAYMELATCYKRAGDLRAEASYRQAILIRPDYWMHWNNLGTLLWSRGDLNGARQAFREATDRSPPSITWPVENLAALEVTVGNYAQALEAYNLLPRPIADAQTASNIGTAHYFLAQLDEAETYYRLAIELQPTDAWLHGNLADVLKKKGLDEEAKAKYREAHEGVLERLLLSPRSETLKIDSALYLAKSGGCTQALRQGHELEATDVSSPAQAHHIAQIFAVCGDQESALRLIELALDLGRPVESIAVDDEFEPLIENPQFRHLIDAEGP